MLKIHLFDACGNAALRAAFIANKWGKFHFGCILHENRIMVSLSKSISCCLLFKASWNYTTRSYPVKVACYSFSSDAKCCLALLKSSLEARDEKSKSFITYVILAQLVGLKNRSLNLASKIGRLVVVLTSVVGTCRNDGMSPAISEGIMTRQRSPTESGRHVRPKRVCVLWGSQEDHPLNFTKNGCSLLQM